MDVLFGLFIALGVLVIADGVRRLLLEHRGRRYRGHDGWTSAAIGGFLVAWGLNHFLASWILFVVSGAMLAVFIWRSWRDWERQQRAKQSTGLG